MTYDLKTSLDEFAEAAYADAPPSTIDIGRARADGRRRMAVARLASIGGGVAVVAACALVVNALGSVAPAAQNGAAAPAKHTFTGTDPLVAIGTFGWLPDGFRTDSYISGSQYGDGITAHSGEAVKPADSPPMLNLYKSATEPAIAGYETKKEVTVKNSRKAYIVTNPASGPNIPPDLSLTWQSESGAWYTLGGDYAIHDEELTTLLIKVAESVRTEESAVPAPIHIEGLPKGVTLGEAMLGAPGRFSGSAMFGITYHTGSVTDPKAYFTISAGLVNAAKDSSLPIADPTAYGPLHITTQTPQIKDKSRTACKDSEGLHICVQDAPGPDGKSALASVGGAQGLLDRITSLGTDPANWTTNVVN
ncbi:hypothetical protein [Catenulispora subtropica]|uniref:LigA n=1 Tax=Catenulispora subtropica TaxID=450798 RepID=A0ABN2T2S7_9ACTN